MEQRGCYWHGNEGCDCKQPERASDDVVMFTSKVSRQAPWPKPEDMVDCPTDRIHRESGISRPAKSAKATPCDRCGKQAEGIVVLREGLSRHYCSARCHRAMAVPGWPEITSANSAAWEAAVSEPD
jgi:hypothetical protein